MNQEVFANKLIVQQHRCDSYSDTVGGNKLLSVLLDN